MMAVPPWTAGEGPAFLEVDGVSAILAREPAVTVAAHALRRPVDFGDALLVVLDDGFVVIRTIPTPPERSVITCEAARSALLMPPAGGEVLEAIVDSRLTVLSRAASDALVAVPSIASVLLRDVQVA